MGGVGAIVIGLVTIAVPILRPPRFIGGASAGLQPCCRGGRRREVELEGVAPLCASATAAMARCVEMSAD